MFTKKQPVVKVAEMGCCGCFGFSFLFSRKPKNGSRSSRGLGLSAHPSQEPLLDEDVEEDVEEDDVGSYNGDDGSDSGNGDDGTDTGNGDDGEYRSPVRRSEDILISRAENGFSCREFPVKETHRLVRSEVITGSKPASSFIAYVFADCWEVIIHFVNGQGMDYVMTDLSQTIAWSCISQNFLYFKFV